MYPPPYYKSCAVPLCNNSTKRTPKKLFIYVPSNEEQRKTWLTLAGRDDSASVSTKSRIYFCEDHFDLPNDMENYMQYSIMGSVRQVRMKPDSLPTKFYCQADSSPAGSKRRRISEDLDDKPEVKQEVQPLDPEDDRTSLHEEISLPTSPTNIKQEPELEDNSQTIQSTEDTGTGISKMKREMEELRIRNQRLTEDNQRLAAENQRLNHKNRNLTSGIDQLLQKSENNLSNYEKENDIVNFELVREHLSNNIQMLNTEIKKQNKDLEVVTEQKIRLTERVKEFQQRIQQYIDKRSGDQQQIKNLNNKIVELKQENRGLNMRNHILNNVIREINQKNEESNKNIEELKCRNKILVEKIEGSRGRKVMNLKEMAAIRSLTDENQVLVEQVKDLTEKLLKANQEHRKKVKERRKLI